MKPLTLTLAASVLLLHGTVLAQPTEPEPDPPAADPPPNEPAPTSDEPTNPLSPATPPSPDDDDTLPATPVPAPPRLSPVPPESPPPAPKLPPDEEEMSEGRLLVSLYNTGFQFGLSPGVMFVEDKVGFALGFHLGYGIDRGAVIFVPGVNLAGYFVDPNVYVGMPTLKLIMPLDRFAPFVKGGAGIGHVNSSGRDSEPESGVAWLVGGGFMIHFTHFAFGAEAAYQVISGTKFSGTSVGPILAFGF